MPSLIKCKFSGVVFLLTTMFFWSNSCITNYIECLYHAIKITINLLFFATKEFQKSRFGNKKTNPSSSMITMTLKIHSNNEMMLLILQNSILQQFNPILQQEIINTKNRKKKKTRTRDACEYEVKRRKENDTKWLWGS